MPFLFVFNLHIFHAHRTDDRFFFSSFAKYLKPNQIGSRARELQYFNVQVFSRILSWILFIDFD